MLVTRILLVQKSYIMRRIYHAW